MAIFPFSSFFFFFNDTATTEIYTLSLHDALPICAVRLAQIDALRHVIYVGSYTKLIGPALRVGFIAADAALIAQLVQRKVLSVLSGSTLLECYVSEVLDTGRYRRHVEHTRARLARLRRGTRAALASAGIEFEPAPGGGIFLWGRVPESAPVDELVQIGRAHV